MKRMMNVLMMISVVLMIWSGISYIEILCKNDKPNPQYSSNNVIVNVIKWADNYFGYTK